MKLGAFSHLAVRVQDMDKALHFYRDLLGFRFIQERMEPLGGPRDDGGPVPQRRAVYLRTQDAPSAFLVLDSRAATTAPAERPSARAAVDHYAWWVDDVQAAYDQLLAAGVRAVLAPRRYTIDWYAEEPGGDALTALFEDPDGNIVQLDQRLGR